MCIHKNLFMEGLDMKYPPHNHIQSLDYERKEICDDSTNPRNSSVPNLIHILRKL